MATVIQGFLLAIILLVLMRLFRPAITSKNKMCQGMTWGQLIYSDEAGGKLLVADKYNLQGKPDFIFQTFVRRKLIPFEIKSGNCKETIPHEGDLMQLVAYFLIIEEVYGKKPPYGKLVYQNKTFKVYNTYRLRVTLKQTLREMNRMLAVGHCSMEAEPSFVKCRNCVCQKTVCKWGKSLDEK